MAEIKTETKTKALNGYMTSVQQAFRTPIRSEPMMYEYRVENNIKVKGRPCKYKNYIYRKRGG